MMGELNRIQTTAEKEEGVEETLEFPSPVGQLSLFEDDPPNGGDDDNLLRCKNLHTGRAGEHLVSCELEARGYGVCPAYQGALYDLLVEVRGHFLKVQVKTGAQAFAYRQHPLGYYFHVSRAFSRGRNKGWNSYTGDDVDLFAFAALDIRKVVFFTAFELLPLHGTLRIAPSSFTPNNIAGITFERCIGALGVVAA